MKELAKQYDPSQVEDRIYQFWLDGGYFHTKADPDKKPYTIVMPPPNVTGQLHMGHAVDNTMQDILIRTKRMQGYAALWVPGTDHASIATEAKVVEAMRAEGLTKEMVGRDGFLERAWAWKTKYGNRIVSQLKKLGSSCDWERERFTMDEGCSEAVKEVFVRLYDKGLIYRGNRMVNWCPHCNTSISDAEVEYEEKDGSFWHLLYPVKETGEMLELATTRPETMLGDTAVAINGEDPRYAHLHGCHVVLPLLNKEIPIVCDEHADMTKGTGVVKITPAHDPNDFEVGLRHDLPIVRVFTYDGHMTGAADKAAADALFAAGKNTVNEPHVLDCGKYAGMTTLEARKARIKAKWNLELPYTLRWLKNWLAGLCGPDGHSVSLQDYTLDIQLDYTVLPEADRLAGEILDMLLTVRPENIHILMTALLQSTGGVRLGAYTERSLHMDLWPLLTNELESTGGVIGAGPLEYRATLEIYPYEQEESGNA